MATREMTREELIRELKRFEELYSKAAEELEQERVQHAGCLVAAEGKRLGKLRDLIILRGVKLKELNDDHGAKVLVDIIKTINEMIEAETLS